MSQNQRVLDYMWRNGSITAIDAMNDLGVMRLASRIHEIKLSGAEIETVMQEGVNRFGEVTKFARYYLKRG